MIDIICPYCCEKVDGTLISEKKIMYCLNDEVITYIREWHGYCKACDVGITLNVASGGLRANESDL